MSHLETAVHIRAVRKTFDHVAALDGFSATVPAAAITGLIGPDGAGKTTLLRLIGGLLTPTQGYIQVFGYDAAKQAPLAQRHMGYMPQRFGLYEDLTVQENLDLYADLHDLPPSRRPERYRQLLTMTGLTPFTRRLAGQLSGGMKQKLGLACVLVSNPRILLLDEPTVGVDPVSRRELWQILQHQVTGHGMTVLLSTAYLSEAERCHKVILIHGGRCLGEGPPPEFSRRMGGRVYLAKAPYLSKRALQLRLLNLPGVLDMTIQGEWVRVITDHPRRRLAGIDNMIVKPAPPRLEDFFVATLVQQSGKKIAAERLALPRKIGVREKHPVIVARNLKRRFGSFYAVKGVSFEVYQGEVFGLLGANGAGKTTTFRMLCGLLPVTEGSASVAGVDLRHAPAKARARIGYMAQKFSLYGHLSVVENLNFFGGVYGLRGRKKTQRIDWALKVFELYPFRDQAALNLPLGYKQRLALACALLHQPEILFLDEPTSGVDPLARREFWLRINILAEQGVTVLVTTHFMEEAEYCDRLVILQTGQVLASGTPEEIRHRARTPENPEPTLEDAFIRLIEARA